MTDANEPDYYGDLTDLLSAIDDVLHDPTRPLFGRPKWQDCYREDRPIQMQHLPALRDLFVKLSEKYGADTD